MSHAKDEAIDIIRRLPETVSTFDILDEMYFKEQIDRGRLTAPFHGRQLQRQPHR